VDWGLGILGLRCAPTQAIDVAPRLGLETDGTGLSRRVPCPPLRGHVFEFLSDCRVENRPFNARRPQDMPMPSHWAWHPAVVATRGSRGAGHENPPHPQPLSRGGERGEEIGM